MNLATFIGGTHPYDGKELSKDRPVKVVLPKGELVYSMSQHLGAPAKPIVAKGDRVLVGQRIAEASAFISAHICSSVSGTVKSIEPRLLPGGNMCQAIIVENDGLYEAVEGFGEKRDYTKLSKEEIRAIVKDAGIVGMGGAGFPNHVKITPKDDNAIDYVLVNAAECEPYLTSDYRMLLEQPEKLIGGLKILLQLFDKAQGVIGIEDNKMDAIELLTKMTENEPRIKVQALKTKYPQGAERALIYACTGGREVHSAILPADMGCVVDNVDTVISIYNAVAENIPLIRRIVTITGDCVKTPQNFEVRTGTNYAELVEEAGGLIKEPEKIISGGPMMGKALFDINVPVTKTSSALLFLSHDDVAAMEPTACIRCGRCVNACPSHLVPQIMIEYAERNDIEGFKRVGGMECYECGSCTYVCPAKRRLTQAFAYARAEGRKRK
ncbi:MAG: electron transport complex subunit RsxC [Lachnospiraceae bacterium]